MNLSSFEFAAFSDSFATPTAKELHSMQMRIDAGETVDVKKEMKKYQAPYVGASGGGGGSMAGVTGISGV